ncbi:MAG TPA: glycosyltransferase family 4 protein [Candidatus Sulfotelmatobacter sp.]|nr:glycosyltransferase family 4 protein [Candidatus Sulfotelmatobacter sp.]
MADSSVSVTLGVGSAPYQKTLIPSLMHAGMLRRVLGPGFDVKDPVDGALQVVSQYPGFAFADRMLWGVWRRIPRKMRPGPPVIARIIACDHLWSRWIPRCNVFHAWSGLCLASLPVAKRLGAVTLLENAARHPRHWHFAGVDECRRFGIKPRERSTVLPRMLIRRIEREYEICDRIIVPSRIARSSLAEFGLGDKALVVAPGVDTELFFPRPTPKDDSMFRACFVGRIELAKGAGYLLQAWKRLALTNAELLLVGEVKPEMNSLLQRYGDSSVRMTGTVPPTRLAGLYRESDVFVFPSVNEGLAQVLLEAMSSGLPIVASDYSGADDLISDGQEGFIVPVRNVDRLAEAISWCYRNREAMRAMGRAARARIEAQFTLEHYNQRQIAVYEALVK